MRWKVAAQRTILILDDDEDTRHLMRVCLERAFPGIVVLESADTETAIAVATGRSLDGVITDHHLGTLEGAAIVQRLRQVGVSCPIVMFTASSDPAVLRRAEEAGAAHVFAGSDTDYIGYFRKQFAP